MSVRKCSDEISDDHSNNNSNDDDDDPCCPVSQVSFMITARRDEERERGRECGDDDIKNVEEKEGLSASSS